MEARIPTWLRPVLGWIRRRLRGEEMTEVPAGSNWRGPGPTAAPALRVSEVADLALVQGVVRGRGADPRIELDGGDVVEGRRFPHPDAPAADVTCITVTLDEVSIGGADRCRLVADGQASGWVDLPPVRTPAGMPGTETIGRCPACRASRMTDVGRRQGLTMQRCTACGLVMTNPRPEEEKTLVRYSEQYFEDEYLVAESEAPGQQAHIDALLDTIEHHRRPGATLFEIGVGGGSLLRRGRERGWHVSGSDVNPAAVEHVRAQGIDVHVGNIDRSESLGGPYDAVVSEMSLEHVRHPDHAVRLAAEALAPGGALLIFTVSGEGESVRYEGMASHLVGPAEHLFLYSAGSLVSLCQRAGLRVDRVWRSPSGDEIGVVAIRPPDVDVRPPTA